MVTEPAMCRIVKGLLASRRYTACLAAADAAGNARVDATTRAFESADASPPTVAAAVLWGSIQGDPALHTCAFTLRFTVDQPCDVAFAVLHGTDEAGSKSGVHLNAKQKL